MENRRPESLYEVFVKINKLDYKTSKIVSDVFLKINQRLRLDDSLDGLGSKNVILNYILGELKSPLNRNKSQDEIIDDIIIKYFALYDKDKKDQISLYAPLATNIKVAFTFLNNVNLPHCKTDPRVSLVNDIFSTIFKKIDAFSTMISLKMYTEAFVSWRTIHESECIVKLLTTGGKKVQNGYIKHIAYNNAYRNPESFSEVQNTTTFNQLKDEMKSHHLKSKDMKKFIEYGWIFYFSKDDTIKLNFRDGVETLAGLRKYNQIYEGASELVHSSSTFFYVNDSFCRDLALDMTYSSAIRIYQNYHDYFKSYFNKKEVENNYLYFYKLLEYTLNYIQSNFDEKNLFEDTSENYKRYKEEYDK